MATQQPQEHAPAPTLNPKTLEERKAILAQAI